jgi:predicted nuclease with TOPRIM domain
MKGMLKDLQSHPEMMDEEMKSMMKDMKNKETEMTEDKAELAQQLEISNKATETLKAELEGVKKELTNKEGQLKVFEQKEAARLKAEEDARWQEIKNKLPIGLTHKEEDVTKLKEEWIGNKDAFYMRHFVNATKPELPGEEGKEIVNQDTDLDKPGEGAKIGEYDPATKEWK